MKRTLSFILVISFALVFGCSRDLEPPVSDTGTQTEDTPPTEQDVEETPQSGPNNQAPNQEPALPESTGVISTVEAEDGTTMAAVLQAQKSYGPSEWEDAEFFIPRDANFELPLKLNVTGGRSGNHLSFVRLKREESKDGLPAEISCVYVGQGSNTPADYSKTDEGYLFDFCYPSEIQVTPSNRQNVKQSSDNLINASSREGTALAFARADSIQLHVNNGNHRKSSSEKHITTIVTLDVYLRF